MARIRRRQLYRNHHEQDPNRYFLKIYTVVYLS